MIGDVTVWYSVVLYVEGARVLVMVLWESQQGLQNQNEDCFLGGGLSCQRLAFVTLRGMRKGLLGNFSLNCLDLSDTDGGRGLSLRDGPKQDRSACSQTMRERMAFKLGGMG